MIRLHDYELSGNCYKARLALAMLGIAHERVGVDFFPGREHKSERFLKLNPKGELPVIEDDGRAIAGSGAILLHLAGRYDGGGRWSPPERADDIARWLAFSDGLTATVSAARLHDCFGYELDADVARAGGRLLLRELDEHLWFGERTGRDWLCEGAHPTIADIACFPYVALSEEAGLSRLDFPAIRRWLDRVKRIPGFVPMPGVFPAGPAD